MTETIHASCVSIGDRAVLILGASGSGKSDLAMRLIDRGAILVSDDYTALRMSGDRLLASPPDTITGQIELRGVGIIERPFLTDIPVSLAVDLDLEPERLPEPELRRFGEIAVPAVGLNGLEPSAPIKVEAALLLHGLPPFCPE